MGLELPDNNLSGCLPDELAALQDLRRLDLSGDEVRLPLPADLLNRVDAGELRLKPTALTSAVEEIVVAFRSTAALCRGYRMTFRSDGSGERIMKRCDEGSAIEYCVRRSGPVHDYDFYRLARVAERTGHREPSRANRLPGATDVGEVTFTVLSGTEEHTWSVNAAALSLNEWILLSAMNGTVAEARRWEEKRLGWCPPEMD